MCTAKNTRRGLRCYPKARVAGNIQRRERIWCTLWSQLAGCCATAPSWRQSTRQAPTCVPFTTRNILRPSRKQTHSTILRLLSAVPAASGAVPCRTCHRKRCHSTLTATTTIQEPHCLRRSWHHVVLHHRHPPPLARTTLWVGIQGHHLLRTTHHTLMKSNPNSAAFASATTAQPSLDCWVTAQPPQVGCSRPRRACIPVRPRLRWRGLVQVGTTLRRVMRQGSAS